MKIGELAARSGLSVHTIRYYERIALLPAAQRDGAGQRNYDAQALVWIGFLRRLRNTAMPIRDMLRYAELRARGSATGAERSALLQQHRERVRAQLAQWQDCLSALDDKIAGYCSPAANHTTPGTPTHDKHDSTNDRTATASARPGAATPGAGGKRRNPARTRAPRAGGD